MKRKALEDERSAHPARKRARKNPKQSYEGKCQKSCKIKRKFEEVLEEVEDQPLKKANSSQHRKNNNMTASPIEPLMSNNACQIKSNSNTIMIERIPEESVKKPCQDHKDSGASTTTDPHVPQPASNVDVACVKQKPITSYFHDPPSSKMPNKPCAKSFSQPSTSAPTKKKPSTKAKIRPSKLIKQDSSQQLITKFTNSKLSPNSQLSQESPLAQDASHSSVDSCCDKTP